MQRQQHGFIGVLRFLLINIATKVLEKKSLQTRLLDLLVQRCEQIKRYLKSFLYLHKHLQSLYYISRISASLHIILFILTLITSTT
jgi:hypothetical protein